MKVVLGVMNTSTPRLQAGGFSSHKRTKSYRAITLSVRDLTL